MFGFATDIGSDADAAAVVAAGARHHPSVWQMVVAVAGSIPNKVHLEILPNFSSANYTYSTLLGRNSFQSSICNGRKW